MVFEKKKVPQKILQRKNIEQKDKGKIERKWKKIKTELRGPNIWLNKDAKKRRKKIIKKVTQGKFPEDKIYK